MAKKIVLLSFCVAIGCIVAASIWSIPANAQEIGEGAAADATFIDLKHLRPACRRKRCFQHRRGDCFDGRL